MFSVDRNVKNARTFSNNLSVQMLDLSWGELVDDAGDKKVEEKQGIEGVEQALAKAFGGPIWFGLLLSFLAIFAGGYVYLIYNYADFKDIPILNGPVGARNWKEWELVSWTVCFWDSKLLSFLEFPFAFRPCSARFHLNSKLQG